MAWPRAPGSVSRGTLPTRPLENGEPSPRPWPRAWHFHPPGARGQGRGAGRARDNQPPPRTQQRPAGLDDPRQASSTPRDHSVETACQAGVAGHHSPGHDPDPLHPELANHRPEERDTPGPGLDECHGQIGPDDLDRDPGDPGPGAEVGNLADLPGQHAKEQEAVKEQVLDDPQGIGGADEPVDPAPLDEQPQVRPELSGLGIQQRPAQDAGCALPEAAKGGRIQAGGFRPERRSWLPGARDAGPCTTAGGSGGGSRPSSRGPAPTAGSGT